MFFRLAARYLVGKKLAFAASEARQKGLVLHRMLDVELRRAYTAVDASRMRDHTLPVIAIAPPQDERLSYEVGESFEFNINVFTEKPEALSYVCVALTRLERDRGQGAEPALRLTRLSSVKPGRPPLTLHDSTSQSTFPSLETQAIDVDSLCAPVIIVQGALSLDTVTPLIITSSAKRRLGFNGEAPKLGRLVRAVLRRCDDCWPEALVALTRTMSREAMEAHADGLDRRAGAVFNEPSPREALSYGSSTHAKPLWLHGYTGRLVVEADWMSLLPVLRVGSWTQVGQKTALGFGVYRLSMIAPIRADN